MDAIVGRVSEVELHDEVVDWMDSLDHAEWDRTVVVMANKGMALELDDKGRLVEKTRRDIAEKVLARLEAAERYEQKRQPLRVIIQSQARHIATFVRGDRPAYVPFVARW